MVDIIYEDNHILVVNKPINMPVQEDSSKDLDLLSYLKSYIKEKYNKPNNIYLGLVHRLDRPVGGVMVFAKTSKAASRLSNQISNNKVNKTYYCVIKNMTLKNEDTLIDYLYKDTKTNRVSVVSKDLGKKSILHYNVIDKKDDFSLVKVDLETGRSHQIRIQFASRNNPLFGETRYSTNTKKNQLALFSKKLCITHPTLKEEMCFEIDLPDFYPFNLWR